VITGFNDPEKETKALFVIDNAENIDPGTGARIRRLLEFVQAPAPKKICISNLNQYQGLRTWLGAKTVEKRCPAWSPEEIEQLMEHEGVGIADNLQTYSQLLARDKRGASACCNGFGQKSSKYGGPLHSETQVCSRSI